ncbi:MAG TPA: LD-carboxypeptidase [Hyphomonadaceae bacterium]|nr:LD-carboxypeptidase [Hyphomonadaceae bacterium]
MGSSEKTVRIGVVAPAGVLTDHGLLDRVSDFVAATYEGRVELLVHPQCRLADGHFAGTDEQRLAALVEYGNREDISAVWFLRGGYGSNRIAAQAVEQLGAAARRKKWLGYSDAGFLLAALHRGGFEQVAHGPMPVDLDRAVRGREAVSRALAWLVDGHPASLEASERADTPKLAFNLTVLSQLLGTPLEPDFSGRVLMIEDVGDYLYRYDRFLFHVTSNASVRRCAGIREGRLIADENPTAVFRVPEGGVVADWCRRSGIRYLGAADIGHDSNNKVVLFR